jgi:hypothetical protein
MQAPSKMPSKKSAIAISGMVLIYLSAWYAGYFFAYVGLVQPDTCWLLKMGQIMVNSHAIPTIDPLSFTWLLSVKPGTTAHLLVYQWLSEVVFYLVYLFLNYKGLLAFGAAVSALTFLSIPLRSSIRANAPSIWCFLTSAFLPMCVGQRFQLRPEIFSCFFLAIWLALLQLVRNIPTTDGTAGGVNWRLTVSLAFVMMLWCNFHTGFIAGIILLAFYGVAFWLEDASNKRKPSSATKTLAASFGLSTFATLLNPYGLGLWLYLPHLFFSPINAMIGELHPITIANLFEPKYLPLLGLIVLCYGVILFSFLKGKNEQSARFDSPVQLMTLLIVQLAVALPFYCSRLVSVSALILFFESANCAGSARMERPTVLSWLDKKWSWLALELVVIAVSVCSVICYAGNEVPIRLPQVTHFFTPPFEGMKVFARIYHGGRIFSSAEIGDMIDLYIPVRQGNFLDTRYDIYTPEIIEQHRTILLAEPGWQKLLDFYKIEWAFLRNDEKVTSLLSQDPAWLAIYNDKEATIFVRRPVPKKALP